MPRIASLCLFCGSRPGADPVHAMLAEAFGRLLAERGVTLVYGGGAIGLMGIAARAAMAAGGEVIGVIPRFLMTEEIAQRGLAKLVVTETLHARKAEMHARADALIALPGGIGTLDELLEAMTWRELGLHDKPIWLLGERHYWLPLIDFLAHIAREGFAPPNLMELAESLPSLGALAERL
jgi:hypothetical protein